MKTVDIQQAALDLETLVDEAAAGETFAISKHGKILVVVEALSPRFGFMKDHLSIPDDFDEMGREEIEKMFYGE